MKITIPEAVRQMLAIVDQLCVAYPKKRFTLDGRLVGDIGEVLVEDAYELQLFEDMKKQHDAEASGGRLVQIKATKGSARLDGSDPKAFVDALLRRLGVDFATLPEEKQAEFFGNDFLALAAVQGDRPPMEDILPTMTMLCFLYSGEADGVLPEMHVCTRCRVPLSYRSQA